MESSIYIGLFDRVQKNREGEEGLEHFLFILLHYNISQPIYSVQRVRQIQIFHCHY